MGACVSGTTAEPGRFGGPMTVKMDDVAPPPPAEAKTPNTGTAV